MNVRQLEAFRTVMLSGSMVAAANLLHVSQPAVSQLIAQFERRCSFRLFDRRRGRIFPTPEAQALFAEVERTFTGIDHLSRVVENLRAHNWGTLSIAAFPAIMRRLLPKIIADYCKTHPDIDIVLESEHSRNMGDIVARREVDLALSILPNDRKEVETTLIYSGSAVCVLPASHRLAERQVIEAKDLEGESFISLGSSDRSRYGIDKLFDNAGIKRMMKIQATQSEAACAFVAEGCGVAIIDPITAFGYTDNRTVIRNFEPDILFKIWLSAPKIATLPALTTDFAQFLRRQIPRLIEKQ